MRQTVSVPLERVVSNELIWRVTMTKKILTFTVEVTSCYDEYSATTSEDDSVHNDPHTALDRTDELNKGYEEKNQDHLWAHVVVNRGN